MRANLIMCFDEGNSEFAETTKFLLQQKFSLAIQDVISVTQIPLYSRVNDIARCLWDSTIIAVGFCENEILNNIKIACNSYYNCMPISTNFGLFYKSGNKYCSIVDISNTQLFNLDEKTLKVLYDIDDTICSKIFGLEYQDIVNRLFSIPEFSIYDYSIFTNYGDTQLVVRSPNNIDLLKRFIYNKFDDCIYSDEAKHLIDCVAELLTIRKERFCLADFVSNGFVKNELLINNVMKTNLVNLDEDELLAIKNPENASLLLEAKDIDFLVMIFGNLNNMNIILKDREFSRSYSLKLNKETKYNLNYLTNFVLNKIFCKLRKNTLLF